MRRVITSSASGLGALVLRLALAGALLTALTFLASVALTS
jgi:hypothetical protein